MRVRWGTVLATAAALLAGAATALAEDRIVILRDGADARAVAARNGVAPTRSVYRTAVDGFAADLTPAEQRRLARDPSVRAITADRTFRLADVNAPQTIGTGVMRIGGLQSPGARINGRDDRRVDADIAIIDSGVDVTHPDVNVVGGVDCSGSGTFSDGFGHGTFVAGTAAAIDNGIGSVGAAPGARIWSVRVVPRSQNIRESNLLCAFEWVTRNADVLEIANISIGGGGADLGRCGLDRRGRLVDPLHAAICAAVSRGVTVTASAGNAGIDAAGETPAAYDEVITVSAYTDFDGRPGGLAPESCFGLPPVPEEDDTMAFFSNFGADVDIAAPGVCIRGPVPGGYGVADGTSFSAPFVAGAAALLLARRPALTPAQVRSELIARGEPGPLAQDPDAFPEPLLRIAGL